MTGALALLGLVGCGGEAPGALSNALGQSGDAGRTIDATGDGAPEAEAFDAEVVDPRADRADENVHDRGDAAADADALPPIDVAAVTARVREGLTQSACEPDAGFLGGALATVVVTPPVDYLDARQGVVEGVGTHIYVHRGEPCRGADAGACAAAFHGLAGIPSSPGWFSLDASPYGNGIGLVFTRGDTAALVRLEDASAFLGSVGTLPAAALVAFLADHRVQCGPGTASLDADGIRLATRHGEPCFSPGIVEERVLVKPDATVVVERSELAERPHCGN